MSLNTRVRLLSSGNCVAHRNYRSFVVFIMMTWCHDIFVIAWSAYFCIYGPEEAPGSACKNHAIHTTV